MNKLIMCKIFIIFRFIAKLLQRLILAAKFLALKKFDVVLLLTT